MDLLLVTAMPLMSFDIAGPSHPIRWIFVVRSIGVCFELVDVGAATMEGGLHGRLDGRAALRW
jgi:hypothetical protein